MDEIEKESTELDALMGELLDDHEPTGPSDQGETPPVGDWFTLAERAEGGQYAEPAAAAAGGLAGAGQQVPPTGAGVRVEQPYQAQEPPPDKKRRRSLLLLPALLLVAALLGGGYWFGRNSQTTSASEADSDNVAAGPAAEEADGDGDGAGDAATGEDADGGSVAADTAGGDAEQDATANTDTGAAGEGETDDGGTDGQEAADGDAPAEDFPSDLLNLTYTEMQAKDLPHAVIIEGQVYLRGRVPSQIVSDLATARTASVVGEENVFNEFTLDVSVPLYTSAPVYVEDVVLFDFNSTDIEEDFVPLLELGTATLLVNPTVTVTVVAFTDAVGSEEANLEVSTRRAEAVREYWVGRGIDASRILIDARGEVGASDDDDDRTAAFNRRVEFIFDGILS